MLMGYDYLISVGAPDLLLDAAVLSRGGYVCFSLCMEL